MASSTASTIAPAVTDADIGTAMVTWPTAGAAPFTGPPLMPLGPAT